MTNLIDGGTELTNKELTGLLLDATGTGRDRVQPVADRLGHDRRHPVDWYRTHRTWWEPLKSR